MSTRRERLARTRTRVASHRKVSSLAEARFSLDTSWASVGMYRRVLAVSSLRSDRDVRA